LVKEMVGYITATICYLENGNVYSSKTNPNRCLGQYPVGGVLVRAIRLG
jgi:hypothetical protein